MGILDPQRLFHGFISLLGGVDNGLNPALIRDDQVAKAINCSLRDGQLTPRPGYDRVDLEFKDTAAADAFGEGTFQAGEYFRTENGSRIVMVVSGRVWAAIPMAPNRFRVDEVTSPGDANHPTRPAFLQQAGRYMVIQDGINLPFLFDGTTCRRASAADEVKVGTVMAYGMGRLWVASGSQIFAGDLIGSKADAEIKFTEQDYLNEGGAFLFPPELGLVRAMVFPSLQDTATGQGELLILGDYGSITIFASVPRDQWKDTPGVQRVHLRNYGATGHKAYALVNSDVLYRSIDGVRSYRQARAENQGWGRTPISSELSPDFETDDQTLLGWARVASFDNRLFVTCRPQPMEDLTVRHNALAVLDYTPVSTLQGTAPPAWEGLWTGLGIVDMVTGKFNGEEQIYFLTRDDDGRNRCYRLNVKTRTDVGGTPITGIIETKRYDFQSPFDEKELYGGDFWFEQMEGPISVNVRWRPDGFWCWADWQLVEECAQMKTEAAADCYLPTPRPQHRRRVKLHTPPETPDPISNDYLRRGMAFQVRLEITGSVMISKFRLHAKAVLEDYQNA